MYFLKTLLAEEHNGKQIVIHLCCKVVLQAVVHCRKIVRQCMLDMAAHIVMDFVKFTVPHIL